VALLDASDVFIDVVIIVDINSVQEFSETMFSHVGTQMGKVVLKFNETIAEAFELLLILIFLRSFT
jgi:hypothetical protein